MSRMVLTTPSRSHFRADVVTREREGGHLAAAALEAPAELDVFHQRHVRIAAQRVEGLAADEDGLVARRDAAPARALVHEPGDHPEYAAGVVEADVEAARDDAGIAGRSVHGGERAVGQVACRRGGRAGRRRAPRARPRSSGGRGRGGSREADRRRSAPRLAAVASVLPPSTRTISAPGKRATRSGSSRSRLARLVEGGDDDADQKTRRRESHGLRSVSLRLQS